MQPRPTPQPPPTTHACTPPPGRGWSNKYDEWVEEEGLLKYDPALLPPEDGGTGPPAATASGEADEEDAGGAEQPGDSGGGATAGPTGPGASRADAGEKAPKKRKAEVAALDAPLPDTTLPPQVRCRAGRGRGRGLRRPCDGVQALGGWCGPALAPCVPPAPLSLCSYACTSLRC